MSSTTCKYCFTNEIHWILKDKDKQVGLGIGIEPEGYIKFVMQYGTWDNLKYSYNGYFSSMQYCPWCGRKL